MIIINDYKSDYPYTDELSCAFGYFDGFHLGHMKVIDKTKESNLKRAVITFNNRPMSFVNHSIKPDKLMSIEDRIEFFEKAGIDYLFIFDFDDEIMHTSKEDFIRNFMVKYHVKHAVVGFNYTFGKNKEGNSENIAQLCQPYGIKVDVMEEACFGEEPISSTLIRKTLYEGDVTAASQMLGRPFYLKGIVDYGKQLGRRIGFPTANIHPDERIILPKWGVYATKCTLSGKVHYGVTNVGNNPTVEDGTKVSVETHIIDFDEEIYGEELKVEFLFKIRNEQKFKNIDGLTEQINRDVKTVRDLK